MGYDRTAPKRAINVTINADLLAQARHYTRNVSGTLEDLLAGFVETERQRRQAEDQKLARLLQTVNQFHAEHGYLSDDFAG